MLKTLCSATSIVLIATFAHAEGLEINVGGTGEDTGGVSAYGNLTYFFYPHSKSSPYLRFSAVQSVYDYVNIGTVHGVTRQLVATIGHKFSKGDETVQFGIGFAYRGASEKGGQIDVNESETSFSAEAQYSLTTASLRSTTLVQYQDPKNTIYGETEILFGLSQDMFVGPVANIFDQNGFSRDQIGLRAVFDFGSDDETVLSLTATTGESRSGSAAPKENSLFSVNVYRSF